MGMSIYVYVHIAMLALGSTLALVLQETSIANYFASQVIHIYVYTYL